MAREPIEKPLQDLLYETLETELGGVAVYEMAVMCARHAELRGEWLTYLDQTRRHVELMRDVLDDLALDPDATTPGRMIVRDKGQALVSAMRKALKDQPAMAEVVAAECVVDAETKDHQNWRLLGEFAKTRNGALSTVLASAAQQIEEQEDEHLYHSRGWARELWRGAVGLPAELPPREEQRDVKSAREAAHAERERKPSKRRGAKDAEEKSARASERAG
jgi:hypothetical protein